MDTATLWVHKATGTDKIYNEVFGICRFLQWYWNESGDIVVDCREAQGGEYHRGELALSFVLCDEEFWEKAGRAEAKQRLFTEYTRLPDILTSTLPWNEYLILAFLIRWQDGYGKHQEEFYCSDATIAKRLSLSKRLVVKTITSLRRKDIISTRTTRVRRKERSVHSHHETKRWIVILYENIPRGA